MPEATWLLSGPTGPCGTVQGLRERGGRRRIQNLGIAARLARPGPGPDPAAAGPARLRQAGLGRALLEVTAQNEAAIRLYRRIGFRRSKTLYKAVADRRARLVPLP